MIFLSPILLLCNVKLWKRFCLALEVNQQYEDLLWLFEDIVKHEGKVESHWACPVMG